MKRESLEQLIAAAAIILLIGTVFILGSQP